jgi:hypothetical protein
VTALAVAGESSTIKDAGQHVCCPRVEAFRQRSDQRQSRAAGQLCDGVLGRGAVVERPEPGRASTQETMNCASPDMNLKDELPPRSLMLTTNVGS